MIAPNANAIAAMLPSTRPPDGEYSGFCVALDFAASRSRSNVRPLRMALVLRLHVRTDRNDLEAIGPRVRDHMLHQNCSSTGTTHALRRVRVFSTDERGSVNGKDTPCPPVGTCDAGHIATSGP